jgi:hypothetical protein
MHIIKEPEPITQEQLIYMSWYLDLILNMPEMPLYEMTNNFK